MHKVKTNRHWAAYLAASEKAAAAKRRPFELKDMTGICQVVFWIYAGGTAAIIGWLLIVGWR
jgi:hypothetical protein